MATFSRVNLLICLCLFCSMVSKAQQANDTTIRTVINDSAAFVDELLQRLQKDDSTMKAPKKSYFAAGLSYLNDNVYLGRKDSVKIP